MNRNQLIELLKMELPLLLFVQEAFTGLQTNVIMPRSLFYFRQMFHLGSRNVGQNKT